MTTNDPSRVSAWFAGPKAENAAWFTDIIRQILDDHYSWRRNYFPEDGIVVTSALRRQNEDFRDAFEDRLMELLARLKADVPCHSPRYAAHMTAEQALPAIAGYFAAMLYNPNNVTAEVAPVTVRLEIEAGRMLCKMIGYAADSWAHLTSGGTLANIEALWMARSVKYLPFVLEEARAELRLSSVAGEHLLGWSPCKALSWLEQTSRESGTLPDGSARLARAMGSSRFNIAQQGVAAVISKVGSEPFVLVPETHHYCFEKALDVLGLGRRALVCVGVDKDFRMRIDDLETKLDRIEKQGGHALAVVAVVGTTEEGSVDPVDEMVALRERRNAAGRPSFWLHADGAYGGYLRTVTVPSRIGLGEPTASVSVGGVPRTIALHLPEHSACKALETISQCDSVTIDPHKLGYIPYPAGAICFRNNLVKALARQEAPYIAEGFQSIEEDRSSEAVGMYVLEGSKPGAAAAAVWLSHSLIPLDNTGHGVLIRETIRNACELHSMLEDFPGMVPGLEVRAVCLCPPGSNIVCYAFCPKSGSPGLAAINGLNRAIHERFSLNPGERVYDQAFLVSRTKLSPAQYAPETVADFLSRLGIGVQEYREHGVFLLRSVMMNPWYSRAKQQGRYFISELVAAMYTQASQLVGPK